MGRKKKEVYKVKPLTEGKKNIIQSLIEEYDIETAEYQHRIVHMIRNTLKYVSFLIFFLYNLY